MVCLAVRAWWWVHSSARALHWRTGGGCNAMRARSVPAGELEQVDEQPTDEQLAQSRHN